MGITSTLGIVWENTAPGTEFHHIICCGIGLLQLSDKNNNNKKRENPIIFLMVFIYKSNNLKIGVNQGALKQVWGSLGLEGGHSN